MCQGRPLAIRHDVTTFVITWAIVAASFMALPTTGRTIKESASDNCQQPLGVATPGVVPFLWMYASDGDSFRGRLHQSAAWTSERVIYSEANSTDPRDYSWIQVGMEASVLVTGVQTQGDPRDDNWVTWFSVYYSTDCERFYPIFDEEDFIARYHGNFDRDTVVTTPLAVAVVARCVRVVPLMRQGNTTALRLELLGCDVRVCREAIVRHMTADDVRQHSAAPLLKPVAVRNSTENLETMSLPSLASPLPRPGRRRRGGTRARPQTHPTIVTRGYVEFKFPAEQILFGLVFLQPRSSERLRAGGRGGKVGREGVGEGEGKGPGSSDRFVVTYSRTCHSWKPIRDSLRSRGDPMLFDERRGPYRTTWHSFPYPVRAQCVRLIPASHRYTVREVTVQAHFIGCGTGRGVTQECGLQKTPHSRQKRVVGGSPSQPHMWPWLVTMEMEDAGDGEFRHLCGATLIHPQWVLTAAHCIATIYSEKIGNYTLDPSVLREPSFLKTFRVRLGEHSFIRQEDTQVTSLIDQVIVPDTYNRSYYIEDMALVKLRTSMRLSDHISLVCLPDSEQLFYNESHCYVAGWGRTEAGINPNRPHFAPVELFPREACQEIFTHIRLTSDMLCAGALDATVDACLGDSGGPLVCELDGHWYQLGVVSWNVGCAYKGYPGVYASVPALGQWIQTAIQNATRLTENTPA